MSQPKKSSLYYYKEPHKSELLEQVRNATAYYPAIKPTGYATKKSTAEVRRVLTAMWSDLHYGSDLDKREHLLPYSNLEETRATAKILTNILSYKPEKRSVTTLDLDFLGDEFAGLLGHDDRAVAPLTFQLLRTSHLIAQVIAHCAAQFPSVRVTKKPGNHGRNLLRHHGRADNAKWDNFETIMFEMVRQICRDLKNVTWRNSRRSWTINKVFGWNKFLTHGDTVGGNARPGTQGFEKFVASINASPYYGGRIDIVEMGHWHSGQQFSVNHTEVFVNPALIPPDGHSESGNYLTACGQFIFESTEKFAVGDVRKIRISPEDYTDSSLDGLLKPWSEEIVFEEDDESED
jgi:hypothetical protein